jgi:hypothetical protein
MPEKSQQDLDSTKNPTERQDTDIKVDNATTEDEMEQYEDHYGAIDDVTEDQLDDEIFMEL